MSKKEMEIQLQKHLSVLMKGNREEVKNAKKEIDRLWHKDTKAFQTAAPIALGYLPKFNQLKSVENQAAFAQGLSLFFLTLGDEYFDILQNFTLELLQHPNGTVREAIRKTADWLFISLSARVHPFVYPKGGKLTEEQKTMKEQAKIQYVKLVKEIEFLIDKYDYGTKRVQYIQDMKPSVNKSLQLLWSRLTESRVYQGILEQTRPIPYEILEKRKDVEKKLSVMLKEAKSDFDLEDIKDAIYNEDGQECLINIIAMFDTGKSLVELQNVLELVNDAWNFFPHETLEGLSPMEKIREYQPTQQKDKIEIN